ncbi:hypothetical protein GCM10011579_020740 [Streptomyces albiflavescens]|uniref:histidine kinase n=1 Tax=Streptomyces albiflavescens TaxID=1623582 RepID=A0A917XZ98_9ACTN|nr:hypothetical protein GCM10011579_020740 [Streptomyces albiflavescens]
MHTPAGTTVTASVEATDEHRVIRVRDDGPGIPPELLPTVFERFTRADVSRSRGPGKEAGTGLGLAIATAITSAHGGRLSVVSEPGRTEFSIELSPRTESGIGLSPRTESGIGLPPAGSAEAHAPVPSQRSADGAQEL